MNYILIFKFWDIQLYRDSTIIILLFGLLVSEDEGTTIPRNVENTA
jgi:hypothetical protein